MPAEGAGIWTLCLCRDRDRRHNGATIDSAIRQHLLPRCLADEFKYLSPDADLLLQEISAAIQEGNGLDQESLLPLLRGLGVPSH